MTAAVETTVITRDETGAYAWYALGLLTLVSVLNYLDRILIYILFTPIKREMSFSDFELRGLWLILLEVTVVKLGVFFNFDYRFLGFLQVIWVIGVSMIVLAGLIHLPLKVVGTKRGGHGGPPLQILPQFAKETGEIGGLVVGVQTTRIG